MSKEKINHVIQTILNEKKELIKSQINSAQASIIKEFDNISRFENWSSFSLPNDLSVGEGQGAQGIDELHQFTQEVSQATNQLLLINKLLEGINQFCTRAALFLVRDDKLVGWNGAGFSGKNGEISDSEIKKIFYSLSADTIFKAVLNSKHPYLGKPSSQPDDHLIYSRLGGRKPDTIFVLPFFVKGKPQAVIYTDSLDGQVIGTKPIEIISTVGEMSLDLLPLRQKMIARVKTQEYVEDSREDSSEHRLDTPLPEQIPQSMKQNDPERKARVIINDMILYNQKVVDDALAKKDLYGAMKDTIEQAKEEYLRKFNDISIFEQQLIRILAKGDKEALKGYRFETI